MITHVLQFGDLEIPISYNPLRHKLCTFFFGSIKKSEGDIKLCVPYLNITILAPLIIEESMSQRPRWELVVACTPEVSWVIIWAFCFYFFIFKKIVLLWVVYFNIERKKFGDLNSWVIIWYYFRWFEPHFYLSTVYLEKNSDKN